MSDWLTNSLGSFFGDPHALLVLVIAGFLPNEVWRMLGLWLGAGVDEGSEILIWVRAVATAILAVIIIMMLYFGREIIIALAILLSFVLAPLVGLLQRLRVPRGLAVVSVVIIAFALIFAMGSLLATQLTQLAQDLPKYQSTITEKMRE